MDQQTVTLLIALFTANGGGYLLLKGIGAWIEKRSNKPSKYLTTEKFEEHSEKLLKKFDEIKEHYEKADEELFKKIKNGAESGYMQKGQCVLQHADIILQIDQKLKSFQSVQEMFLTQIQDLVKQRTFEDGIKRKHDVIVANAIAFLKNKEIHDFAIFKAGAMKDYILDNYKTMFTGDDKTDYGIFKDKITALAETVRVQGMKVAGSSLTYVSFFYSNYHKQATNQYITDVKQIFSDAVNNKSERFVDVSMLFMQKFLSDMVACYADWVGDNAIKKLSLESTIEDN